MRRFVVQWRLIWRILSILLCGAGSARAQGLTWPTNQLLPTFAAPAAILDCIDVSSASKPENDLFASLEGIVNRTQPQIVCASSGDGEGGFTWINLHNLPYNVTNGYGCILKYRSYLAGLVVTDPNEADTLDLATTIAGVKNELICDPSLLSRLTNAPYNLPVNDDLRGRFSNKYQVYGYLYTNYWPLCTHRIIAGMETNLDGIFRDYLVAVKSATVWLDPGNSQDAALLGKFVSNMTPLNAVYLGWWPSEGNGLTWIAGFGIPVLASDFFRNGSVFGGVARTINIPPIPPTPPLTNKVYVSLILSDGDNAQYMEHVMKMWWENPARGKVPIGWTADALVADLDPAMINYYWSTASSNDCLISGPDGPGYAHLELWNSANVAGLANTTDRYLQRAGFRSITVWDNVNSGIARAYATNCPTLLGLFDQGGNYSSVNLGLKTIALTPTYASTTNSIISAIASAASGFNGSAPLFIAAQAVPWSLTPSDLLNIAKSFNSSEYQFVRPDHLFLLSQRAYGMPSATTLPALGIAAASARLLGMITGNATNAMAWLEWGTNENYGSRSPATLIGSTNATVSATISGLIARQVYHYRAVASNTLGMAWGADKIFDTGGPVKVWSTAATAVTNLPPGLTNAVRIAAGANHALALRNDGTVIAWGDNSFGQTNVPAGLGNVLDISAGSQHSLALLSNGTVVAWGGNADGQTNVPVNLTNVIAIAAGAYHNLALSANGQVTAWGYNTSGQTNVPAGLANVVGVAAGYAHSVALLANGGVTAWGNNSFGQTSIPGGVTNVVAIAAGNYHTLALKADASAWNNPRPASRWTADRLSGANGSAVTNWLDVISGAAATQTAPASQPLLFTNVLNGHNTVRFSSAAGDYLAVTAANSAISGARDFSIVVVFRTSSPGASSPDFYHNTGLLGADVPNLAADWSLVVNGSELGTGLGAGDGGCGADVSIYGGNVTDANAHIGACVRSGDTIRVYVDGVIVAEQTGLCTAPRVSCPFDIGAMTTAPNYFNGDMAEIQLYTQALNATEMATLSRTLADTYGLAGVAGAMTSRWVADSLAGVSGSSISIWMATLGGASAVQMSPANRPKLYRNVLNGHSTMRFAGGSSQYLTVAAADSPLSGAGNFTIVTVFRTSTAGTVAPNFYGNTGLLGADVPGAADDWSLVLNGTQLGAGLGVAANGCSSDFSLYSGGNVTDGAPHIGTYVRDADTVALYIDGIKAASQSGLCTDARVDCLFEIGAMTGPQYYYNGDIAEIRFYNRALSPGEVSAVSETLSTTYGIGGPSGPISVWGDNNFGVTNVPVNLTNVLAVCSGSQSFFNLALRANGTVEGWGNGSSGQTNPPSGLTNVTAIAAGAAFGLAIGHQLPVADNLAVSGYVNHDLTLALPSNDPDGNHLNFYITSLPGAGALYQDLGGSRGAEITVPNTLVSSSSGQLIFAPASGATGNPYASFNFVAEDPYYRSASAQVTVNIGSPAIPQFAHWSWNLTNNIFDLEFSGSSNAMYSVWSSTNLIDWADLGVGNEVQPGVYQFIDSTATNSAREFFRISAP
jgi:alpha-tubulin suppressor-like RCC1 family protein